MTESWRKKLDSNMFVAVYFLDYRKAFDSLNHDVIKKKLTASGVTGDLYEWLSDYLKDRQQVTSINGQMSECENLDTGTPQGSLLGPRLFSTVNDLPDISTDHEEDLFADDTTGSCTGETMDILMVNVQKMVNDISRWSCKNHLTIHPTKSVLMIMQPKTFIGPLPQILLDGKPVKVVSKAKCLGITIDNKLSWNEHVSAITKSFSVKLKKFYQMRSLSMKSLITVYEQGILPSITYGLMIWDNATKSNIDQLDKLHQKAVRYVKRINKKVPNDQVFSVAGWKFFHLMYKQQLACLTYKLYTNNLPEPLSVWKSHARNQRSLRNRHRVDLPKLTIYRIKSRGHIVVQ